MILQKPHIRRFPSGGWVCENPLTGEWTFAATATQAYSLYLTIHPELKALYAAGTP